MSPMNHRNTRNPYMVAEQEFRTTTPEPASQRPRRRDSQPHISQQGSQEMLETATSVTTFGKKDTAAESQSHAARTQDTLVNAVENAEVNEITRAVFRALTRLRAAETKEFDTIVQLGTQITNEENKTFRHETVSHEFKTALVAGAHDEEEKQGCQECWCGERGFTPDTVSTQQRS